MPKMAATWPQEPPKRLQDGPKRPQEGPKRLPRGTKRLSRVPRECPEKPQLTQLNSNTLLHTLDFFYLIYLLCLSGLRCLLYSLYSIYLGAFSLTYLYLLTYSLTYSIAYLLADSQLADQLGPAECAKRFNKVLLSTALCP